MTHFHFVIFSHVFSVPGTISSCYSGPDTVGRRCFRGTHLVTSGSEDVAMCAALVQQNGSAAPVSVLHDEAVHGARLPFTAHRPHIQSDSHSVSNFWSKFVRKIRRVPSKKDPHRQKLCPNSQAEAIVPASTLQVTNNKLQSDNHCLEASIFTQDCQDPSSKLIRTFISERQGNDPAETVFGYTESQSSSRTIDTIDSNSVIDGNSRNTAVDHRGNTPLTFTSSTSNNSTEFSNGADKSQWCNTLPARRVRADNFKGRSNRPVSLEIKVSPEECSSPLSNYLSSSCNFRAPEEVVLSKSRTRVKTPRHPPLPRLALNSHDQLFTAT